MPKFICLNDDMNKTHAPDPRLLTALKEFFVSYYPKPSPFELPEDKPNPVLYMDELRLHLQDNKPLLGTLTGPSSEGSSVYYRVTVFVVVVVALVLAVPPCLFACHFVAAYFTKNYY